jgi:hypothetical protein
MSHLSSSLSSVALALAFTALSTLAGCSAEVTDGEDVDTVEAEARRGGNGSRATAPVNADGTCPAGFELEVELEHGVTSKQCKQHRNR